ncbi:hypothetical protein NE865_16428 [Phthorimaea operculella]|nr:hypothetical protein NE865_16428 [Phthorimaea operculella]
MSLSNEQFLKLLEAVGSGKKGSLATCKSTYDGKGERETLEAFLAAINVFKKVENISDEDALMGLPLVLKDDAATGWQGIKEKITVWSDFEKRIRHTFAPERPVHTIYEDIVNLKQGKTPIDKHVAQKRVLFSQLPKPGHTESQQLDMLFASLNLAIKDKITRSSVKTYDELLEKARAVEEHITERDEGKNPSSSLPFKKTRCGFCKITGHTTEECRRLKKKTEAATREKQVETTASQMPSPSSPKIACYGCGAPGVVRTKCVTCNKPKSEPGNTVSFNSFASTKVKKLDARSRPVVFITVAGIHGTAFVDPCAESSIASYELYTCLKNKGYKFETVNTWITQADGFARKQDVLTVTVTVTLCGRNTVAEFVVLPQSRDNKTLLGVGFIQDALMHLNIPQFTFTFLDDPLNEYELYKEEFALFKRKEKSAQDIKKRIECPLNAVTVQTPQDNQLLEEPSTVAAQPPVESATIPYELKRVDASTPPRKKTRATLFDGYSPRFADSMYRDAQINVHRMYDEIELSPRAESLFPVKDDDINICSIQIASNEINLSDTILKKEEQSNQMPAAMRLEQFYSRGRTRMSKSAQGYSAKFAPRRDGPYLVTRQHGPSSYELAAPSTPEQPLGVYHASALMPFRSPDDEVEEIPSPVQPLRKRGRPRKQPTDEVPSLRERGRGRGRGGARQNRN